MTELVSPNGTRVEAMDGAVPMLLAAGFEPVRAAAPEPGPADLAALTAAQLRDMCGERGIEAPRRATKAQLVELLR